MFRLYSLLQNDPPPQLTPTPHNPPNPPTTHPPHPPPPPNPKTPRHNTIYITDDFDFPSATLPTPLSSFLFEDPFLGNEEDMFTPFGTARFPIALAVIRGSPIFLAHPLCPPPPHTPSPVALVIRFRYLFFSYSAFPYPKLRRFFRRLYLVFPHYFGQTFLPNLQPVVRRFFAAFTRSPVASLLLPDRSPPFIVATFPFFCFGSTSCAPPLMEG